MDDEDQVDDSIKKSAAVILVLTAAISLVAMTQCSGSNGTGGSYFHSYGGGYGGGYSGGSSAGGDSASHSSGEAGRGGFGGSAHSASS